MGEQWDQGLASPTFQSRHPHDNHTRTRCGSHGTAPLSHCPNVRANTHGPKQKQGSPWPPHLGLEERCDLGSVSQLTAEYDRSSSS